MTTSVSTINPARPLALSSQPWRALRQAWPLLLIGGGFAAWALLSLNRFAFSNDEGIYLMWTRMMSHGYALYRDIWADQPPLIMLTLMGAFNVFGESVNVARAVAVLVATVGLLSVGGIAWLAAGRWAGVAAASLLGLAPLFNWFGRAVMSDVPANSLFALALLVAVWGRRPGVRRATLVGVLLGLSLMIKLIALPLAPLVLAALVFHDREPRRWLALTAAWAVGLVATLALILAPFDLALASRSMIGVLFSAREATDAPLAATLDRLWRVILQGHVGIVLLALVGLAWCITRPTLPRVIAVVWLALTAPLILLHRPLFDHHLVLAVFPVAVLAGVGIAALGQRGPWRVAAGAAAIAYIVTLPVTFNASFADTGYILDDAPQILRDLETVTTADDWIITDRPVHAFRAGLLIPPYLADTGGKRLASDAVDIGEWVRQTAQFMPSAILFGRPGNDVEANYLRWIGHIYHTAGQYSKSQRLWAPEAGGPVIDTGARNLAPGAAIDAYGISTATPAPGQDMRLGVFWSTEEALPGTRLRARLIGPRSEVVDEDVGAPETAEHWEHAASWMLERRVLTVPGDAASGAYSVELTMVDDGGQPVTPPLRLPTPITVGSR